MYTGSQKLEVPYLTAKVLSDQDVANACWVPWHEARRISMDFHYKAQAVL